MGGMLKDALVEELGCRRLFGCRHGIADHLAPAANFFTGFKLIRVIDGPGLDAGELLAFQFVVQPEG